MSDSTILSAGFCAPILWGVRQAFSIEEIAEGGLGKYLAWRRAHEGAARELDALARGGRGHV